MDFQSSVSGKVYSIFLYIWWNSCCFPWRNFMELEGAGNTVSNLWRAIGYSLLGLGVCLLALVHASLSLVLLICSLQFFLRFESKNSTYFQANIKYGNARTLITNLVTICCITSIAFLYNPYT